jgi:sigma-E factor negative regulatory protein RseC
MIEKTFTVAKVEHNKVTFLLPKPQACQGCDGKCGSLTFAKLFANKRSELSLNCDEPLEVGQKVDLALDDSHIIAMSFWTYLFPLVLALGMAVSIVSLANANEFYQILAALFGGSTGLLIAKNKQSGLKNRIQIKKIHPISLPIKQINGD